MGRLSVLADAQCTSTTWPEVAVYALLVFLALAVLVCGTALLVHFRPAKRDVSQPTVRGEGVER
jgi:hypothetical protein